MECRLKKMLRIGDLEKTKYGDVRLTYRTARMRANWLIHGYPTHLMVETNRRCNLHCSYCAASKLLEAGKLGRAEMSDQLYDQILSEVSQTIGRSINVVGVGGLQEPLLDKKLLDRIDLARIYFPRAALTITTNATLLTPELGKQLINRLDGLCISLNSFDRATYQSLNNRDAYQSTLENIRTFLDMKGERKPFTEIQLLNVESNKPYVSAFLEYYGKWSRSNIKLKLHDLHSWAGNLDGYPQKPQMMRRPCVQLWDYLWFSAEGDAYPCCLGEVAHDLCFGNIRDGVPSLLNSRKLAEMRLRHLFNQYPGSCQNCQVWREKVAPMIKIGKRWV